MTKPAAEFDEKRWEKVIQRPDWYLEFNDFALKARLKAEPESKPQKRLNKQVRRFFEAALRDGKVNIGERGYNFDAERQPVDTIVIHHTSAKPGYKLSFLNAVQLLNIYVPGYATGKERGRPIWSGHFHKGKQVFWGYHWLMRMDGKFERLLDDSQIGWHAGDWEINKRSIGICLDNDYENRGPRQPILPQLANFIKQNYPDIPLENIRGHREASLKTICPGNTFLTSWKPKLLKYLSDGS
jgi:hypothetical protein